MSKYFVAALNIKGLKNVLQIPSLARPVLSKRAIALCSQSLGIANPTKISCAIPKLKVISLVVDN